MFLPCDHGLDFLHQLYLRVLSINVFCSEAGTFLFSFTFFVKKEYLETCDTTLLYQIWRGTRRPNSRLPRDQISGVNGDREKKNREKKKRFLCSPDHMNEQRIGKYTWLIHTNIMLMTTHAVDEMMGNDGGRAGVLLTHGTIFRAHGCWLARRLHQFKASTTMDLGISIFLISVQNVWP